MKKLTKLEKQLMEGLYQLYHGKGDATVMVGDDSKTKIRDEGVMKILSLQTAKNHKQFMEETHALAKKLGVKVEIKSIIKLI